MKRSAHEPHYSQQMTESERHREKIDKKTFQRLRSRIIHSMHRAINNNSCERSRDLNIAKRENREMNKHKLTDIEHSINASKRSRDEQY